MILMVSWMTSRWPEVGGALRENALLATAVFAYQIVCPSVGLGRRHNVFTTKVPTTKAFALDTLGENTI